jgi:hypothetical protein
MKVCCSSPDPADMDTVRGIVDAEIEDFLRYGYTTEYAVSRLSSDFQECLEYFAELDIEAYNDYREALNYLFMIIK